VTLGSERDQLGMRRLEIRWHWDSLSRYSARRTAEILEQEMLRCGIGTVKQLAIGRFRPNGHHPIGITRMHDDPKRGVVDKNCVVHG
jgi:choline dehydrogenase-like flavoprotein